MICMVYTCITFLEISKKLNYYIEIDFFPFKITSHPNRRRFVIFELKRYDIRYI